MSTASTARVVPLALEALDVLFFRDGRPFGAATRAATGRPTSQTLAGALWTAVLEKHGCDFARLAAKLKQGNDIATAIEAGDGPRWVAELEVRGPWLARLDEHRQVADVFVPAPATLLKTKGRTGGDSPDLPQLTPLPPGLLAGWQAPHPGLRPLWVKDPRTTTAAEGYLGRAGLEKFLAGKPLTPTDVVPSELLFGFDHRTGIELLADQLTSKEGGIYGASFLALRPAYTAREREEATGEQLPATAFYAEVALGADAPDGALDGVSLLALGGEGRRARVSRTRAFAWPEPAPALQAASAKSFVLLTTPGFFENGWKPRDLAPAAAAVPGYVAVSGWDLARGGPKATRFAAAAGSVYFFDTLLTHVPAALSDRDEDRRQGWGCCLKGVWNDA